MDTLVANQQTTKANVDPGHLAGQSVLNKSIAVAKTENSVKISIILPTNAYFMSGIRDFTKTVVQNMTGFSEKWAFRFQSVVDELTNNAIEFGSTPGEDIKITFVSVKNRYIEVFVEDTGTGSIKKTAAEMTAFVQKQRGLDPSKITTLRGRGLTQIVANWTDMLEFKDNEKGGITVHVMKHLNTGEQY